MTKVLVVTPGYPKDNNIYNNVFIHSRVKKYIENGIDVEVFYFDKENNTNYIYDDIFVEVGNHTRLKNKIIRTNWDKILIHFAYKKFMKTILEYRKDIKLIIWIHGVEGLGWYRRLFNISLKPIELIKFGGYILVNTKQMLFMKKLITEENITFIFVSKWMKNIFEKDTKSINKIKDYKIIPNVVNEKNFSYKEKKESDRLNILSIRPYESKKYANDISVKAVLKLAKKDFFKELSFSFFGKGKLFKSTLKPLKRFPNIHIYNKYLTAEEIKKEHDKHGIILIPTRQDAQGVSMCEAMSSGLVPITSNNTAIPEYVDKECGYLTNNVKEIVDAMEDIYLNPHKFLEMSKNSSKKIINKCSSKVVIDEELKLIMGD